MSPPDAPALYRAIEQTWCPASRHRVGPWMIRDGQDGGQRVSATTAEADWTPADLPAAETAMRDLDQPNLFLIREGETHLDQILADRGYGVVDPVVLHLVPVERLTQTPVPPVSAFQVWPPLAIMADIWAAGGIGPDRLSVMNRATGAKTAILARQADQPAGVAFAAMCEDVAMVHAIEVTPALRRQHVGHNILRSTAHWAQDQGAAWLGLAVTRANTGANALYASLGMQVVGHYHYRKKTPDVRSET